MRPQLTKTAKTARSVTSIVGIALAALLIVTSCTSDNAESDGKGDPSQSDVETILFSSSLETLDSCDEVLERIKEDALERVGPYGLEQPGTFDEVEVPLAGEDGDFAEEDSSLDQPVGAPVEDAEEATPSRPAPENEVAEAAPADDAGGDVARQSGENTANTTAADEAKETSGTNNQEEGVDEADLVKSDGETLVIVSGSNLRVLDVTGDQPKLTETISIRNLGNPTGMFLNGDRLVLMSVDYERGGNGQTTSLLTEINLETGRIGGTAEFEGQYVSSREVDGTLRMVLTAVPTELNFVYPNGRTDAEDAELENRDIIERSKLEDWIPEYRITGNTTRQSSEPLVDCSQVHIPKTFSGGGQVVVITADLDRPLEVRDALSVHTDAQTVYASTERLVVASPQWPDLSNPEDSGSFSTPFRSALHSFDISTPNTTDYVASGAVRGLLLNQFSLSEHNGNLRVATTDEGTRRGWIDDFVGDVEPEMSESFVTVLSENDGALVADGQVGGLGRGERIFAVRFIGNVGYVVTFRETDPLYTVDLSEPSDPRVIGELKIPGFSNYLHEIDERTLMGVGSDGTDSGQILGAAVSIFDVEDLSDPTRLDKLVFEDNSSTPIATDAKAFTYWRKTNTAIVPVETYEFSDRDIFLEELSPEELEELERGGEPGEYYGGPVSEAAVIDVDPDEGRVELRGMINHLGRCDQPSTRSTQRRVPRGETGAAETSSPAPDDYYEPCYDAPVISRTMVIGEDLYTFSSYGIAVHTLDELDEKAWVSFR